MDDNIGSFLSDGTLAKWLARRVISNYTLPNFDFHIANSTYTAEEFYASLATKTNPHRSLRFLNACWRFFKAPRVPIAERIYVCPRGVDAGQFTPSRKSEEIRREMRETANLPANSIVLLYAGRISPEKNIGLLVDIMEQLESDPRDFRLIVAGAGPQSEWLQGESERRTSGKIIQLGHLEKEKLADYYANADIFVHPNPKEPFGIAPLEAMASGVATVAPNAGGILSYADGENAWLVEPTGAAFADAIREIADDEIARNRKIANALQTALENTREAATDRLLDTYDLMYEDFNSRRDLFTNNESAKDFNFVKMITREPRLIGDSNAESK